MKYKPVIGLEIHIELDTHSKMFCSCPNNPREEEPNKNICEICSAQPGSLPVINKKAVEFIIKTALALNCQIEKNNYFERKNYFYPDLPKGYQISQFQIPISKNGYLLLEEGRKIPKKVRITRIHLEEDTGSSAHKGEHSLINYNRAGTPLMELVTEPDITSGKESRKFAKNLQLILRYLGVSEANMEWGQMRVEVNISLKKENDSKMGTKVEIKNLNSIKAVEKAIDYEIKRQTEMLENGEKIGQQTRGWDEAKQTTLPQREKEESHDYRYFPEPDLPPLEISDKEIEKIKLSIPELPAQKRKRLKEQYNLTDEQTKLFVKFPEIADYFEKVSSETYNWMRNREIELTAENKQEAINLAVNYISSDLLGILGSANDFSKNKFPITAENFAEFIVMIYLSEISSKIAKKLLPEMYKSGADPSHILEEKNLSLIKNFAQIEKMAEEVVEENKKAVEDFRKGKKTAIKFLVGQMMAKSKGKAIPQEAEKEIKKILKN